MNHVDRPISHVERSSAPAHHLDLHRFSLDIDQAFETVECRQRRDMEHSANQWFYDEFSGMYRHKAPRGHPQKSPPLFQQRSSVFCSSPTISNSSSPSWQRVPAANWPLPETAEQIYAWRDEARRQPQWMLRLACHLMDIQLSDSQLRQVAANEAYRLLKRLTQYRGSHCGEAHYILGNYHGFGYFHGTRNADQAYIMYTQASKQNHGEATYRTAVCHERGLGTHQDPARAFAFYRKAAHLGHPASMYKLGIVLLEGQLGQSVHKREAVSWLQRAVETNSIPLAQHTLAMIQLNHPGNDDTGLIIEDYPYAIGLLYDAAQLGFCPSQVKLGECFEHGQFVHQDMDLALYWYTKAAESGSAEASIALSGIYFTGLGALEQSDREAYLWARKAVTLAWTQYRKRGVDRWTLAKANFMVGYYIEHGIGTESVDAMKWYKRAAELGHAAASKRLAREKAQNNNESIAPNHCAVM
ncbi:hypothetical protein BJV82DRAFT_714229 [Fennellomyces sp. T-0311]|nr:hypothetical protein BJV82DRAFT_714229 [Fennellomyces sp. T-0311]